MRFLAFDMILPSVKVAVQMLCNFIEIALQDGYSPVNLLHILRTPFLKDTYRRLLLFSFQLI